MTWLQRLRIYFCHHDDMYRREDGRLMLECLKCGRRTPGIHVPNAVKRKESNA